MNPILLTTFWDVVIWISIAFFWIALLWMFVSSFADIFRRRDLSGGAKAVWIILLILLPLLGLLAYIISRPPTAVYAEDVVAITSGQTSAGGYSSADEIARAQQLLTAGTITQEEFEKIKASALA